MKLRTMYNTVILAVIALVLVVAALLFNFWFLIDKSQRLYNEEDELVALSNEVMHTNNTLVKLMRRFMVSYDPAVRAEYESILNDPATFNDKIDRMKEIGLTESELADLDQLLVLLDELARLETDALNLYDSGYSQKGSEIINGAEYIKSDKDLEDFTANLIKSISERTGQDVQDIRNQIQIFMIIVGAFLGAAFFVFIIMQAAQKKKVLTPIEELRTIMSRVSKGEIEISIKTDRTDEFGNLFANVSEMTQSIKNQCYILERIAEGDLTVNVEIRGKNDAMNKALSKTVSDLNEIFAAIKQNSLQVTAGSSQIRDGAQVLADGSTKQAATIEELSASISEITEKTKNNAKMADTAAELANGIMNNAQESSEYMSSMIEAVDEINRANQSISQVIKAIDDIAFQTNILALNAAVEAARAGEAGKGFAVVADEVRNLAAKSAESAKNTGGLISNSLEKAHLGTEIAGQTAESLKKIVDGVNQSNKVNAEIAASSEEQASAIEQINIAVNEVTDVVQQNSATAQESAAASEQMSSQAQELESLLSKFKLRG